MMTAFIFKININIIHNSSSYEHKINMYEEDNKLKTLYLGHLNEMHYVPLQQITNNHDIIEDLYHDEIEIEFYKWSSKMWKNKQRSEHKLNISR
jgi:hypothetical protein